MRVGENRLGRVEDVADALAAPRGQDEHAKADRCRVLKSVIEAQLPLPAIAVLVGADRLGAVVEFDEKRERKPGRRDELERAIGIERLAADRQSQRVLAVEAGEFQTGPWRTRGRVHDEVGQPQRVELAGNADRTERPLGRRCCLVGAKKLVPEPAERVIAERAAAGGGVQPPTHPAGGGELLQAFADAAFGGERGGEGPAQFQELFGRQRAAVEGREDL